MHILDCKTQKEAMETACQALDRNPSLKIAIIFDYKSQIYHVYLARK